MHDDRVNLLEGRVAAEDGVEDRQAEAGDHKRDKWNGDRLAADGEVSAHRGAGFNHLHLGVSRVEAEGLHRRDLLIEHGRLADLGGEERKGRRADDHEDGHEGAERARPRGDIGVGRPRREDDAGHPGGEAAWRSGRGRGANDRIGQRQPRIY